MAVTPATSTGAVGSTVTLTANLTPSGATDTVQWESSDPSVATVAPKGQKTAEVTRVKEGTATITAKVREFTATTAITVTAAP
ncbi:MAG: Ig-like domain-containing protein [Pantoea sp.]|nr:Ig-like domain-containing protein [Pantoea sp.]